MSAPIRWALALVTFTLGGVALNAARAEPRASIQDVLRPYLDAPTADRPIQAAVLLQARDCSGNLRILELLHRSTVRERLSLAALFYAGPLADSTKIRALLPPWTIRVRLVHAPNNFLAALHELGHTMTPVIIVLQHHGGVRLISDAPESLREFAGLQKIIEGLTWVEEL